MKKRLIYLVCIFSVQAALAMHKTQVAKAEEVETFAGLVKLIDEKWNNLTAESKKNEHDQQARLAQIKLYVARASDKQRKQLVYELLNGESQAQGGAREFVLQKALGDFEDAGLWKQLIELGADANAENAFGKFADQALDNGPSYADPVRLQAVRNHINDILLQIECGVQPFEAAINLKELCNSSSIEKKDVFKVIEELAIAKGNASDALTKLSEDFRALISGGRASENATPERMVHLKKQIEDLKKAAEQKEAVLTIPQVAGIAAATCVIGFVIAKLTSTN